ncbi:transposon Ty3-I Gag-Pol polyprotein [Trichonephila inaurata madagascariensis]|uniref:Transposon Ty3-I Gag-Pol polyprotein n=1 Tax=Trichonephila inaurata madagascariensis TaxID=2747483 RepID=A0A8X6XD51_9ARAC|nr:transposon Ty3-I Gag-Pol polyprotein [Trichonephila inaurata madagascariensis]
MSMSTDAAKAINRLENQRHAFGNSARIITDKGSVFPSSAFEDYCNKQNILHISITTGLPRSNGQIEKQNPTIIVVLSKLSVDNPEKWYFHVPHLQEILNSTFQRSIKIKMEHENETRKEASFWKMVLQRLFGIILTLSKNSLAFRGHRENKSGWIP